MSDAARVFEILMRENADMLLAFIRGSVRDTHAVDDIFQEAMIVAWKRLDDFDRERSFGKWVRGIAGKLILAHYRKTGRNPLAMDESTLEWMETRFAQIQRLQGDTLNEKLSLLRDCVDALSEDNRKTIESRYLKQNSLEEIVGQLGVALQTVKKRLYRAKQQLEDCLHHKLIAMEESA